MEVSVPNAGRGEEKKGRPRRTWRDSGGYERRGTVLGRCAGQE